MHTLMTQLYNLKSQEDEQKGVESQSVIKTVKFVAAQADNLAAERYGKRL